MIAGLAGSLVYECYCGRKDILNAPAHRTHRRRVPGTLPRPDRHAAQPATEGGRPQRYDCGPRADEYTVTDLLHGRYTGVVDDFVLRRGDGLPAYNLAVVVDDAHAGIDQVVRGDDLLPSSPRQAYLAELLGYPQPVYAHVPLALNADGKRLAKRDGAVTLSELGVLRAWELITGSLGWPAAVAPTRKAEGDRRCRPCSSFNPEHLPREPWTYEPR